MELKGGKRLASAADSTEVIVVRAPGGDVDVTCGGLPMVDVGSPEAAQGPLSGDGEGTLLGKRYVDEAGTIELLATKAGPGSLAVGGVPLVTKESKPLPASD